MLCSAILMLRAGKLPTSEFENLQKSHVIKSNPCKKNKKYPPRYCDYLDGLMQSSQ